jgi:serine/threonine protein kinase
MTLVLVNRTTEFHFVPENIHISDFGIPYCCRLPVGTQSIDVPGTFPYLAPEIRDNGIGSNLASDMWAVGCIGYELCIGKKLAENNDALEDYIRNVRRNPDAIRILLATIPPRFSGPVHAVIRECLRWDPNKRCGADDVRRFLLEHYQKPGDEFTGSPH